MILLKILLAIIAAILAYILFLGISVLLFSDPRKEYDCYSGYFHVLVQSVFSWIMFIWRIRISSSGLEKVPTDTRYLLVGNHRSNFDPLVTGKVFKKHHLSFISKERNLHIFIAGRLIRRICYMAIDRENARNAVATIERASRLIRDDVTSIAVYPEGTRSKTDEMLAFHNGVFKIAQKANVPIVIACIKGTEKVSRNYPLHRTKVHLKIVDVLPAEYVASHRTNEISDKVRKILEEALAQ